MTEDHHDRLRVGVIGVGLLGERHARFWAQQPDVELVGVADARLIALRTSHANGRGTVHTRRPRSY
jgi:predicted dehydrogenase